MSDLPTSSRERYRPVAISEAGLRGLAIAFLTGRAPTPHGSHPQSARFRCRACTSRGDSLPAIAKRPQDTPTCELVMPDNETTRARRRLAFPGARQRAVEPDIHSCRARQSRSRSNYLAQSTPSVSLSAPPTEKPQLRRTLLRYPLVVVSNRTNAVDISLAPAPVVQERQLPEPSISTPPNYHHHCGVDEAVAIWLC